MIIPPQQKPYLNSRTIQQPRWHGYELSWVHPKDAMASQGCWHPLHTHTMDIDEERLNDKVQFLRNVRTWLQSKAINGHAYVKLGVRRKWIAWANRRINYLLRKLEAV